MFCLPWGICQSGQRQLLAICIDGNVIGDNEFGAGVKRALLAGDWDKSHIQLVTEKSAEALFDALEWAHTQKSDIDMLFFYFTGHGYLGGVQLGADKISFDQLHDEFVKFENIPMCIIIDACHSGSAIPFLEKENRVLITSCQDDETSGYFSEALISALGPPADCYGNLDGFTSAEELYAHILADWQISTYTPQLSDSFEGNLTILSTYWEGKKPEVYQVHDQQGLDMFDNHKLLRQSFIPITTPIAGVALKIGSWDATADILVEIYEENMSLRGQAVIPANELANLTKSSWVFIETNFSVIPGIPHDIVCKSNSTYWWWGSNDWYSGGQAWVSFDQGQTWQPHTQISDLSFIMYGLRDNTPPTVAITHPQAGKIFSGLLPIEWIAVDNSDQNLNGSITLLSSSDSGHHWNIIASGISNRGRFQWNTVEEDDGTDYLIKITAVDESRNLGVNISKGVFVIDNTAPATKLSTVPALADGLNGWFKGDVAIALNPTDNTSGVGDSKYQLDNDTWQDYTDEFLISSGGVHEMKFYSVDNAGNLETPNKVAIKIDGVNPVTACTFRPDGPTGENGWYVDNVSITLSASDTFSGVNHTSYRLDGGEYAIYETALDLADEGDYTLQYSSIDKAGNQEELHTVPVKLDKTKPSIDITIPEQGLYIYDRKILPLVNNILIIGKVTIKVNASDLISNIDKVCFHSDSKTYIDSKEPYEWQWDEPGFATRILTAIAHDNAGLVQTDKIEVIMLNI
jgi:hypothetical protein